MTKRRRKPYRPRPIRTPLIVGAQLVFAPLQAIIDQIERDGTVTATVHGAPVFQDGDGIWYDTVAALEGVIEHCDMWGTRHGRELPLAALRQFVRFLRHGLVIPENLMRSLKADLPALQAVMARGNPDDMLDLLRQVQIKIEIEKTTVAEAAL